MAQELAELCPTGSRLLCGRYEGVDQRISDHLVDGELSVGDFVLAGGELGALVVIEAVARLLPDVLGNEDSSPRREFLGRPARIPPLHPPGRIPRLGGPSRAALGRPRRGGPLAAPPGPPSHRRPAPRPAGTPGTCSDADVRVLSEHGYHVPSGTEPEQRKDAPHAPH